MGRPGGAVIARAAGEAAAAGGTVARSEAAAADLGGGAAKAAEAPQPRIPTREQISQELRTAPPGAKGGPSTGDLLSVALATVGLPAIGAAGFWVGGTLLQARERAERPVREAGRMALLRWSLEQSQNPADMPADQRAELEAMLGGSWSYRGEDAPMPPQVRRYLEQNRGAPEVRALLNAYDPRSGRRKRPALP